MRFLGELRFLRHALKFAQTLARIIQLLFLCQIIGLALLMLFLQLCQLHVKLLEFRLGFNANLLLFRFLHRNFGQISGNLRVTLIEALLHFR